MKKFKNRTIFILGKKLNGIFYPKNQEMRLPKETVVSLEWEGNIGKATNFRQVKNKVFCDILINDEAAKKIEGYNSAVVPKMSGEKTKSGMEDLELIDVSIVLCPADKELKNNLKKREG